MVKYRSVVWISVAALILSTSFAPFNLWFTAPISYALYLKILLANKRPELHSFIFAFLSNAAILSWSKTFVGVTPWILLAILQGLYLIPVGYLSHFVKNPYAILAALMIVEEVKNRFPFGGFGWTRVAFSQADSPLVGVTSIVGVTGFSLITLLIACAIYRPSALVLISLFLVLVISQFSLPISNDGRSLNVRAIQGGVPERGLSFNARAQAVLDNHISVTKDDFVLSDEVILWPENAIDVDPLTNVEVKKKLQELQHFTSTPLIAGAITDGFELSNSAILFDSVASPKSIYIKRYLTPFGEYIPLRNIASKISQHTDRVTDFSPGNQLVVHEVNGVSISTVICYEILSDSIIRESAQQSGVITVLTNSATFAGSSEGLQQLNITRIRAVETGRNIVSVSTTGPSAFVSYRGEVNQSLSDGEVGSIAGPIGVRRHQTIAAEYGGRITSLVIVFSIALIGLSLRRRGRDQ